MKNYQFNPFITNNIFDVINTKSQIARKNMVPRFVGPKNLSIKAERNDKIK